MAKVAILNPMGDYGQNTYGHDLAEAVGRAGQDVLFLTCGPAHIFEELPTPKSHERQVLLGSFIFRQIGPLRRRAPNAGTASAASSPASSLPQRPVLSSDTSDWRGWAMTWELLFYAKLRGVRWLWTQWPDMRPYSWLLRKHARQMGFRLAHTVHNVLPHEPQAVDRVIAQRVYEESDLLFVHSEQARRRLFAEFPAIDPAKVHMYRLGAFTTYPRCPEGRSEWRRIWEVRPEQTVWLACGLIRPYKNIDSLLEAFAGWENPDAVLVVQGKEAGFPGACDEDPLRYTMAKAQELGLGDRVRWVPGEVSVREMSALMEAADGLAVPYRQGSGSGLLSLAIKFGMHVLAAKIGGAEEYIEEYGWGTLLGDCSVVDIRRGLCVAEQKLRAAEGRRGEVPESLSWAESGRRASEAIHIVESSQS